MFIIIMISYLLQFFSSEILEFLITLNFNSEVESEKQAMTLLGCQLTDYHYHFKFLTYLKSQKLIVLCL